jgi:beta-lactamase superfamily II metal-dependent hydrolase
VEEVTAGKTRQLGRLTLTVLHPETGVRPRGGETDVNNGSVVVKAVYGESRYLFPGDCELGCWEEMFKLHRPELRADVLKAAHHGSSNGTSSGVLVNVRPRTVIISCGVGNRYGHPHGIVLKLVEKLRAALFRTDEQGTIRCAGTDCRPMVAVREKAGKPGIGD